MRTLIAPPHPLTEKQSKQVGTRFRQGYDQSFRAWNCEDNPLVPNYQFEHWDGRLDALIQPAPVRGFINVNSGERTYENGWVSPALIGNMKGWRKWAIKKLLRYQELGAVTASGFFIATELDAKDTTQLALDLDLETHRIAIFTDSVTPNFSTDTAYGVAPYDANETSGGANWASGGELLTGTTYTEAESGHAVFDASDLSKAVTTITNGMAFLIYADALAGNNAYCLVDAVTAFSTSSGQLDITWTAAASGGVANHDLTP